MHGELTAHNIKTLSLFFKSSAFHYCFQKGGKIGGAQIRHGEAKHEKDNKAIPCREPWVGHITEPLHSISNGAIRHIDARIGRNVLLLPLPEVAALSTGEIQHATALLAVIVNQSELDPVVQAAEMQNRRLLSLLLRLVLLVVELAGKVLFVRRCRRQRRELRFFAHYGETNREKLLGRVNPPTLLDPRDVNSSCVGALRFTDAAGSVLGAGMLLVTHQAGKYLDSLEL